MPKYKEPRVYPQQTTAQRAFRSWQLHATGDPTVWRVASADGETLFHIGTRDLTSHEYFRRRWQQATGSDCGPRSSEAWEAEIRDATKEMRAR